MTKIDLLRIVFIGLSKNPTKENKVIAKEIFQKVKDVNVFTKMNCDKELIILGLAKEVIYHSIGSEYDIEIRYGDFQDEN